MPGPLVALQVDQVLSQTEKAIQILCGHKRRWVPKSQLHPEDVAFLWGHHGPPLPNPVCIDVPHWLPKKWEEEDLAKGDDGNHHAPVHTPPPESAQNVLPFAPPAPGLPPPPVPAAPYRNPENPPLKPGTSLHILDLVEGVEDLVAQTQASKQQLLVALIYQALAVADNRYAVWDVLLSLHVEFKRGNLIDPKADTDLAEAFRLAKGLFKDLGLHD